MNRAASESLRHQ